MIQIPESKSLIPQCIPFAEGQKIYTFRASATDLLRIDLLHESGSAYQLQKLCAAAANNLYTAATKTLDAAQVAEFLDYRGIVVQHDIDIFQCTTSFYLLRRHLDELLPLLYDFLNAPRFAAEDFDIYIRRRKQEIQAAQMKTADVAHRLFYNTLFGDNHPLGSYARPEDADLLTVDAVSSFFAERYGRMNMVLSGNVDDEAIHAVSSLFGKGEGHNILPDMSSCGFDRTGLVCKNVPGAAQTTLRVGRVIPLKWNDPDYARFVLLTAMLGGYFGSRLMGNIREEHGYTYGIYAHTRICRGVIVFFITTDVASDTCVAAEEEIKHELQRLCDTPADENELELVKKVVVGDFIRSVDGVFERAERFGSMLSTGVDETFTDNLRTAIKETTADQLHVLAQRLLNPDSMLYCRVSP